MDTMKSPYARLAWPSLFEMNENEKYACALLIPKNKEALSGLVAGGLNENHVKVILSGAESFRKDVIEISNSESKAPGFKGERLFKDGSEVADRLLDKFKDENPDKELPGYYEVYRDYWVINIASKFQPKFYGPKASDGELGVPWAEQEVYGGCWCRIDIRGYNWNFKGKKGYSLGMGGVFQKAFDDKPFFDSSASSSNQVDDAIEFTPNKQEEDFLS